MLAAILLALALVVATVLIHYEMLRATSGLIPRLRVPPHGRILVVIGGVFVAHLLEISLYAAVYAAALPLGLGGISGALEGNALDYFYLSITTYTTLGVGDLYPTGALRVLTSVESLNGFVLIGWSASFTYLSMEKFWEVHRAGSSP